MQYPYEPDDAQPAEQSEGEARSDPGAESRPAATAPASPTTHAAQKRGGFWAPLGIGIVAGALVIGAPLGGVVGGVAGAQLVSRFSPAAERPASVQTGVTQQTPLTPLVNNSAGTTDLTALYQTVVKSVVQVNSSSRRSSGIGSGFVVDKNGHILTNYHVVQGATSITVRFQDGTQLPAQVLGTDPSGDLAVLKANVPANVPPLPMGDSDQVKPGEDAIAIGSPLGLDYSITSGIVSGIERTSSSGNGRPLSGLIQTDAAINPGNSGGPLLDAQGRVIGINTLGGEGVQNIGFAVPINAAKQLLPRLISGETIQHPWLGIGVEELPQGGGITIVNVTSGSPAAQAGLRSGDTIVSVAGKQVKDLDALHSALEEHKVGESVSMGIVRNNQNLTVNVTLGNWPTQG